MKNRLAATLTVLAAAAVAATVLADDDLRPGVDGIASIEALADVLRETQPGRLLKLELEQEQGQPVYEIKLLTADGRVVKMVLDARDLSVLARRSGRHEDEDHDD